MEKNSKIYVDLFPCNECAKEIIQSGIKEVIYLSDKYAHTNETIVSKKKIKCIRMNDYNFIDIVNDKFLR